MLQAIAQQDPRREITIFHILSHDKVALLYAKRLLFLNNDTVNLRICKKYSTFARYLIRMP
jgi:hypothetical protein